MFLHKRLFISLKIASRPPRQHFGYVIILLLNRIAMGRGQLGCLIHGRLIDIINGRLFRRELGLSQHLTSLGPFPNRRINDRLRMLLKGLNVF